jgi:hypothetical protein
VSHVKVVADRMLSEMLDPFALNGREVRLRTSIGIAVSETGYVRAEDVLRDAETALHRAPVLGGSHSEVFDTAILKSTENELRLEAEFDSALERRDFELFFQPIVSLTSNPVVGFEAPPGAGAPAAASSSTLAAPPQPPRGSTNAAANAPEPPSAVSDDVSHLHRLGSCRGRLVVSEKGSRSFRATGTMPSRSNTRSFSKSSTTTC